MGLAARLVLGIVLGVALGAIGNTVGWFTAFSVPEGLISVPFMALMTGLGAGFGAYLGWRIDVDGNPSAPLVLLLPLALACGLTGAWLGFLYGDSDEGTRIWRYPVTQATIIGAAIGANIGPTLYSAIRKLVARQAAAPPQPSEYFQALKEMPMGSAAKTTDHTNQRE